MMRTWRIEIWGESHTVVAATRSAARYASWRMAREAGYRISLFDFASQARIRAERDV
jgi:hypothetical protein